MPEQKAMPRWWSVLVLCLCCALLGHAQSVRVFTADQGLSSSLIRKIYQDRNGIVWIATEDGLNRYDGVKLTVYRNHPKDKHSLQHNYVRTLFEDREGHLLVGTYGGIQLYDPATDSFSLPAKFKDGSDEENNITAIAERRNGEVWVSGNVMCRLEITESGEVFYERLDLPIPTTLVETVMVDREDNVWISKVDDGVYRLGADGKVKSFSIDKDTPYIISLCEDSEGNIYGGTTRHGLYLLDKAQDKFLPLFTDARQDFPVFCIYTGASGEVYIGTDGNGMKVFDKQTGLFTDYQFEENTFAAKNAKIHDVYVDRSDNYWIGVYQKGVLMVPSRRNGFNYWGNKSASKNIIGDCYVASLYRDDKGTTYVGTDNDGLYIIDKEGRQQSHFTHSAGDARSVPSVIVSIFEDSAHHLWLGSYADGAAWLDPQSGRCTYLDGLTDSNGNKATNVYAFAEDNRRQVWIATMGNGLFRYDLVTGRITHIPQEDNWIGCLHYSAEKDNLFLGSYNGLSRIDLEQPEKAPQYALQQSIVYTLHESGDGHIWAGTSMGLLEWDVEADTIHQYTTDDGLCNDFVYAIQSGDDGSLWISTSGGISRFLPDGHEFTNFYVGDGLQGNEFGKNASWRDGEGVLWFGGVNGITYFNPTEITVANKEWHVRVTDFYLSGKPVRKGMLSGGKEIIDRPVFEAETFHLAHNDNAFTIEFSTVELDNTDRIIYEYAMDDGQWINLPHGTNQVSFSNLVPGTYRFRLRAKDGLTTSEAKQVTIHIASPWWNSAWAWFVYVLVACGIILLVVWQARQRYKARQERLRLLRAEQLNEEKLQYFINISHEIRTPMTLIISPLKQLMDQDGDDKRQRVYRTIYRNADRLLSLVNQLMDIRKIDKGQMRMHFREVDIVKLIDELHDTFLDPAQKKGLTFTFTHEGLDRMPVWIDSAGFDKILLNLLSNAFKFTPDGGTIEIALQERHDGQAEPPPLRHCAEITVTDSGIGIDASELERIFDRFYQVQNSLNYKGTGIGLHLTRLLVQLHHGIIFARNLPDGAHGSRFVVRLPLGSAHLRPDELEALDKQESSVTPSTPLKEAGMGVLLPEKEDASAPGRSTHRILLVEDDEEIRRYLRQEFSDRYRVEECVNGKEALEHIFRKAPDLVISDIMMPEMDGLTLCHKIKQNIRFNHIPVILLTAKVREQDNIEGLDIGADAYIMKPFNMDVLRHTVKNLLRSREQLRTIYRGGQQAGEEKLEKITAQSPDDKLMERIMKAVNAHLSDPGLTVETIASEIGISRVHLHRKLKELTNQTTRDFLRNMRMKQAATLLAEKRHSITEVAALVGYDNLSTFSTCFKEVYGVSPSAYCESHLASKAEEAHGTGDAGSADQPS